MSTMLQPVSAQEPTPGRQEPKERVRLRDDFLDDVHSGAVIGTRATSGDERKGLDVEGVLSIDNGALRIQPLVDTGFGRVQLGYGPFPKQPGLAFAVYMLNGHNTAQAEPSPDTLVQRFKLWLNGSRVDAPSKRLMQWLGSKHIRRVLRQLKIWRRMQKGGRPVQRLDENLAVGWFSTLDKLDPRERGNPFIMHALGPENGELWVGESAHRTRALRGVQNVPIYYVAVLRPEGAVYYVASIESAIGPSAYPWLRPVAIDPGPASNEVYVGVHQSVLGQIGWRIDSRVYGVRVADLGGYDSWCGGAHAADRLPLGAGSYPEGEAVGRWQIWRGQAPVADSASHGSVRTMSIAVLDPQASSGLICAVATAAGGTPKGGLVWRCVDAHNHWCLQVDGETCEVILVAQGERHVIASRSIAARDTQQRRLQVLDDGTRVMAYVDGEPLSDKWLVDSRLSDATQVGILFEELAGGASSVQRFEAHPRHVHLPQALDMGAPWLRTGSRVVIEDDFSGAVGDIDGRKTTLGDQHWRRIIGKGVFETTGKGAARVRASTSEKCPGRTAYCVDWSHPEFVDIETTITPPGTAVGQRHLTTAGFILYQDEDNYMMLNCYRGDYYPGGSISTFFKFEGYEDVYDAVWANVAERVRYGCPLRLRLCSDGERYLVFINDEAVLYRAFRDVYADVKPLRINKVGLLANWEFGTDTGSVFEQCRIRT